MDVRIKGLSEVDVPRLPPTETEYLGRKLRSGRIRSSARIATVTLGSVAGFRRTKTHIAKAARREKTSEGTIMA
jgi:ribosomal protein L2